MSTTYLVDIDVAGPADADAVIASLRKEAGTIMFRVMRFDYSAEANPSQGVHLMVRQEVGLCSPLCVRGATTRNLVRSMKRAIRRAGAKGALDIRVLDLDRVEWLPESEMFP